jgi:cation diffusion facilitator CzcD-associated flavoprotein CzcO
VSTGNGAGPAPSPRVVIIGAGFGGVGLGMRLKQAGIESFTILEKGDGVGGVWRDNTYPGLTCDIPSHLYSFSFEPKLDWSRRFPPQPEILEYLEGCVDKYGLLEHLRLSTAVVAVEFDRAKAAWSIETAAGELLEADVVVTATGQLSRPALPDLPGLEDFAGACFHSARWDHDCDLAGKRVAVIGTGASSIQFIPEVAREAARLHVFQRSAPWVIPKPDRPYGDRERSLYRRFPWLQSLSRLWDYLLYESRVLAFTRFQWMLKPYETIYRRKIRRIVSDQTLQDRLIPDYPMGCKRILLSSEWFETLQRPDVEVITEPIRKITAEGIVTGDGVERPLDAIVLGTGFQTTDFLAPMRIGGLDGKDLNEVWRDGAEAYLGLTVAGFPNLFMLYGPNTNLGVGSIIFMLESQISYVVEAVRALGGIRADYMDVRAEVQAAFNAEIQDRLAGSVWQAGCSNWYMTESGKNTNNWPGLTLEYRRRTRRPDFADYRLHEAV